MTRNWTLEISGFFTYNQGLMKQSRINGSIPVEFSTTITTTTHGDTIFFFFFFLGGSLFFFKAQFLKSGSLMYSLNAFIFPLISSICCSYWMSVTLTCKQNDYLPIKYDSSGTEKNPFIYKYCSLAVFFDTCNLKSFSKELDGHNKLHQ